VRNVVLLTLIFFTTILNAQTTTELVDKLTSCLEKRAIINATGANKDELAKNTLRLQEMVTELRTVKSKLLADELPKLAEAETILASLPPEGKEFTEYDLKAFKKTLMTYLDKKHAWLQNTQAMMQDALAIIDGKVFNKQELSPEEVSIMANIFLFQTEALRMNRIDTGSYDVSTLSELVLLQSLILKNLKTVADVGAVNITDLIGYSDILSALISCNGVDIAREAELGKKVSEAKEGFKACKSLVK